MRYKMSPNSQWFQKYKLSNLKEQNVNPSKYSCNDSGNREIWGSKLQLAIIFPALFQKVLIFEKFLLHFKVKNFEAITARPKTLLSH